MADFDRPRQGLAGFSIEKGRPIDPQTLEKLKVSNLVIKDSRLEFMESSSNLEPAQSRVERILEKSNSRALPLFGCPVGLCLDLEPRQCAEPLN